MKSSYLPHQISSPFESRDLRQHIFSFFSPDAIGHFAQTSKFNQAEMQAHAARCLENTFHMKVPDGENVIAYYQNLMQEISRLAVLLVIQEIYMKKKNLSHQHQEVDETTLIALKKIEARAHVLVNELSSRNHDEFYLNKQLMAKGISTYTQELIVAIESKKWPIDTALIENLIEAGKGLKTFAEQKALGYWDQSVPHEKLMIEHNLCLALDSINEIYSKYHQAQEVVIDEITDALYQLDKRFLNSKAALLQYLYDLASDYQISKKEVEENINFYQQVLTSFMQFNPDINICDYIRSCTLTTNISIPFLIINPIVPSFGNKHLVEEEKLFSYALLNILKFIPAVNASELLKLMITKFPNIVHADLSLDHEYSLLHAAVKAASPECVKLLLAAGVDPNISQSLNPFQGRIVRTTSPISHAIKGLLKTTNADQQFKEILSLLLAYKAWADVFHFVTFQDAFDTVMRYQDLTTEKYNILEELVAQFGDTPRSTPQPLLSM